MTATVIPFRRTLATYKAKCEDCRAGDGIFRYLPTPEQIDRWALVHSRAYWHTVRLADGTVYRNGLKYEMGVSDGFD